jgi:uncharacterized protein
MEDLLYPLVLFATGGVAGIINAVAGGGPILTLGMLSLTGIDSRIANLTSTVALSPGQIAAGWKVRHRLHDIQLGQPSLLLGAAIFGGALGAGLLLVTASPVFDGLVPWLVLFATGIYAASGFSAVTRRIIMLDNKHVLSGLFAPLALYGGYFGGGNSFLVLALLGVSGHEPRLSGEIKNVLIAAINLGAVVVFGSFGPVDWPVAVSLGAGGIFGSLIGARLLGVLPVRMIRWTVIIAGLALAGWMFRR